MLSTYDHSATSPGLHSVVDSNFLSLPASRTTSTQGFNILFLIDQLVEMGGAELAMLRLIRSLPKYGIRPRVVTFKESLPDALRASFPCPVTEIPISRTYGLSGLRAASRIRSLIISEHIGLVHTFFETSDLFGGLVVRTIPHVALVSSRRDMGILRNPKHRMAYRYMARMADRVVTVSDRVRDWCIAEDRIEPERVVTVYNGVGDEDVVTPPEREESRQRLGLRRDQLLVSAIGHIRHIKGFDVMIEAARIVVASHPEVVFLIAGGDHEKGRKAELEAQIRIANLEANFWLLGPQDNIGFILAASDVFLLPSRSEGFSNALIEAMMAGLPCVATDVGGNGEALAEGSTGYLVPSESPSSMARALQLLLRSAHLRASMGRAGRHVALQKFTQATMAESMVALYRQLVPKQN